jgi:signal transduction histidine kinase
MMVTMAGAIDEQDPAVRLQRILQAQAVLGRVAADLGPDLDLDEVLSTVIEAMRKLIDFRGGSVQLVDERGVYVAAADPPIAPEVMALRIPVGSGLSGRVIATAQPVLSTNLDEDDRVIPEVRTTGTNAQMRSYAAVPLVCLGETIGALQIDSSNVEAFDEDDVALLEGLAAQVAAIIESARRFALVIELERLKHDFISRVSHELRTPLTIVEGFVTMMLEHDENLTPEERRDMLTRCNSATARLDRLIEELIMLARFETGVVTVQPVETSLIRLLDDVVLAATDPALVMVECPPDLTITIDPELTKRLLGLLVDNALKYGGGARLCVTSNGRTIEIQDDGPGIADDVKQSIFELFTRGRGITDVPGLGLGLPMARALAAAVGADLMIEDGPVKGTVVRLTLSGR